MSGENEYSKVTAVEFYRVMNTEVLEAISRAFVSLHYDLLYDDKETRKEVIDWKLHDCKKTINAFIDGQREMLLKL